MEDLVDLFAEPAYPEGEPRRAEGSSAASSGPAEPLAALAAGDSIGRYLLLRKVGSGGFGVVYAAYDPQLDRKIALKVLRGGKTGPEGPTHERLLREAQAMARLSHPNVTAVYDVAALGERIAIAMEFIDGSDLRAWLREKPRAWREILRVFLQAGRGLAAAHAAGIVHRDFKPANVLIGRDGRVSVTDFGLAWLDSQPDEGAGGQVGTPAYMAPEQQVGLRATARSDQYSFGVALHEALSGERARSTTRRSSPRRCSSSPPRTAAKGRRSGPERGRSVPLISSPVGPPLPIQRAAPLRRAGARVVAGCPRPRRGREGGVGRSIPVPCPFSARASGALLPWAGRMDVTALCSLPVGIVRWTSGDALTVVVKATFALDRDGEARLAEVQEPLYPDVPDLRSELDELRRASDFAPAKARAEIQIVGTARPGSPTTRVEARVSAGAWAKRFVAVAPGPEAAIPLLAAYLRRHDGRPERVAPWSPERAALARAGGLGAGRVAFDLHNAAPPDQQLDALTPDLPLTFEGLLPTGPRRVRLPGMEPLVLAARGADTMEAVELVCDTLVVDLDREICSLTWRGRIGWARPQDEPTELVVALSTRSVKATWSRVIAQLATATRTQAAELPSQPQELWPEQEDEEPPTPRPAQAQSARGPWDDLDETTSASSAPRAAAWDEPITSSLSELLDDELTSSMRDPRCVGCSTSRPRTTLRNVAWLGGSRNRHPPSGVAPRISTASSPRSGSSACSSGGAKQLNSGSRSAGGTGARSRRHAASWVPAREARGSQLAGIGAKQAGAGLRELSGAAGSSRGGAGVPTRRARSRVKPIPAGLRRSISTSSGSDSSHPPYASS